MTTPGSQTSRQRYRRFVEAYRQGRIHRPEGAGAAASRAPRGRRHLAQYLRWLRPHGRTIALVLGLALTVEAMKMVEPLFMRFIIDQVLLDAAGDASARVRRLNTAGAAFLGLIVLGHVLGTFKDHRQRLMNGRLKVSLRRSMFARMLNLPLSRLEEMKTGGILSRLTGDVDVTSGFLQKVVVLPAVSAVRLVIAAGVLLTLNWRLAVAVLAVLPGLVLVSFAMARRVRPIYSAMRGDAEEVDGRAGEAFSGIRIVRAFHRETRELLDYMRGQHAMLRKEMFAYQRELLLWMFWGLLLAGFNVVILWYGGYLNIQGRASIGDIIAFQWYANLLLTPVLNIINSFSEVQRSHAVMERVFDVLAMEEDKPDRPGAREAPRAVREIRFEHLDFEYRRGRPVVTDFHVNVPGGATVALVGRSGAGKTTVMDLIARFHDPTRGRILLNGTDIRDLRIRGYRDLFAIVQQHVFLFDGSVRDNIAYARPDATDAEVEDAARRANAHGFIQRLPEGYGTRIGERGVKLSGGQQQRLAIARAFLKEPAILILDEATSNLDTESEQLIQASIKELMGGRTTFVIAHRLSTIRQADLILVIDDGRVVERGRHEELMGRRGEYREMVVRQMVEVGQGSESFR
jgi:ATP-binding cassette subfamily B protein/subfamily B ATP-binding cassette protein MsbA